MVVGDELSIDVFIYNQNDFDLIYSISDIANDPNLQLTFLTFVTAPVVKANSVETQPFTVKALTATKKATVTIVGSASKDGDNSITFEDQVT